MHAHSHASLVGPCAGKAPAAGRRLGAALSLSLLTATIELVGARQSGSLALLADAGHVAFDSLAIALAWGALRLAMRPASQVHTWGYGRAEVLAAAFNGLALLAVAAGLAHEGITRISHPVQVVVPTMLAVAAAGLVCNGVSLWLLETHRDNVGVRAAFLHVAGDVLVALTVLLGGAWMALTGSTAVDGWLTVGIAAVLAVGALQMLRSIGRVLMEGAPVHLQVQEVRAALLQLTGVGAVDALKVWSITPSDHAAVVHLRGQGEAQPLAASQLVEAANALLRDRFGLSHVTVQVRQCSLAQDFERGH